MILSFIVFPKPLSWKYCLGGALVAASLYFMQRMGKKPLPEGPGGKERERDHGAGGEKVALLAGSR